MVLIFQKPIEELFFRGKTSVIDEASVLLLATIALWLQLGKQNIPKVFSKLGFIFIYLILISLLFGVNRDLFQIIAQSFLHLIFFIVLISLFIIHKNYPGYAKKAFMLAVVITIVGVILQLMMPVAFMNVFPPSEIVLRNISMGNIRISGFQMNPNALGVFLSLVVVFLTLQKEKVSNSLYLKGLFFTSLILLILTGSRSALIFVMIGFLFAEIKTSTKIMSTLGVLIILNFTGIYGLIAKKTNQNIDMIMNTSITEVNYPRWLMAYKGTEIALDHLPIGTGAATFGTVLSKGNPVYYNVGIANVPAVEDASGIYDSNYGSLSGEFGLVGLIIFYGFGAYLIRKIMSFRISSLLLNKSRQRAVVYCFCLIGFVATFMRPLFFSGYYATIFSLLIIGYLEVQNQKEAQELHARSIPPADKESHSLNYKHK